MPPLAQKHPARAAPRLVLSVQYAISAQHVPTPARFRTWARAALRCQVRVTLRIVGAAEARKLNRDFRGADHATNVLSFAYGRAPGDKSCLCGDVVLCDPVVKREARTQGKALAAHYAHLTVHGLLHLQGFDHQDDDHARRMQKREVHILRTLGFDDPYIA
ncbi:MAG: rRNA maturation RNase YbeY [Burkholderiales bacterium]